MHKLIHKLILASESPRRKKILSDAGYEFDTLPAKVSEIPDKNLNVNEQILDIARRKARAIIDKHTFEKNREYFILSADTEVVVDNRTLGKPADATEAKQFLDLLSARSHDVKTAVCIIHWPSLKEKSHLETTEIEFRKISEEEKIAYVSSNEPFDKAGGYGIQGEAKKFVTKITGELDNVVGLPLKTVEKLLTELNYSM